MKKFIPYSLLLFCTLLNSFSSLCQKKYNVLFIVIDDLNIAFDTYGNTDAPSPNFARLIQHGMLFKQAYCQYALCGPSRTSFLSGYRPDKTGIFDNKVSPRSHLGSTFKFLPEYFQSFNYYTERFGKIGPCGHESEVTWDAVYKSHFHSEDELTNTPSWWIDTTAKNDHETLSGVLTTGLVNTLRNPPPSPYFLGFGIWTHNPWTPILSEWNKIGDPTVKELLPVDIDGTITDVKGNGSANIQLPDTPPDDTADIPEIALKDLLYYSTDDWQRLRHSYYSEIEAMDFHLGEILDQLDALNLWDKTIVVFTSDHGLHLGEHQGLWLKQTLFEESSRIPFVLCVPGKKTGICNTPVEMVDLFPTLTELCDLPSPPDLEGSSLVPLLENPNARWKKAIFSQVTRTLHRSTIMGRAVRTNTLHYNSWDGNGEELYDIVNDPYEYTNLYDDPSHLDDLNKMRNLLAGGWQNALPPVYPKRSFFKDADGDGYGNSSDSIVAYFAPDGYVIKQGDCKDNNPNVHPGAKEKSCNGIDDNCDGNIDENRPVPAITALGDLDICETGSVVLQANGGGGLTYQWIKNNTDIEGATKRNFATTTVGDYKVAVTHSGCSNISKKTVVTNSCITIGSNENIISDATASSSQLQLSPNPSTGIVKVTYKSSNTLKIQLKIIDMTGRTLSVKSEQAIKGVNIFQLNLSYLIPDTYYLELSGSSSQQRIKFLIEK